MCCCPGCKASCFVSGHNLHRCLRQHLGRRVWTHFVMLPAHLCSRIQNELMACRGMQACADHQLCFSNMTNLHADALDKLEITASQAEEPQDTGAKLQGVLQAAQNLIEQVTR